MHPCEVAGHEVVHLAVRIPWRGGPIQVEHECHTFGCVNRLNPWLEPARDVEAVLIKVLANRPGIRINRTPDEEAAVLPDHLLIQRLGRDSPNHEGFHEEPRRQQP